MCCDPFSLLIFYLRNDKLTTDYFTKICLKAFKSVQKSTVYHISHKFEWTYIYRIKERITTDRLSQNMSMNTGFLATDFDETAILTITFCLTMFKLYQYIFEIFQLLFQITLQIAKGLLYAWDYRNAWKNVKFECFKWQWGYLSFIVSWKCNFGKISV